MEDEAKHLFDSEAEKAFFSSHQRSFSPHQPDLLISVHAANIKVGKRKKTKSWLTNQSVAS